MKKLIIVLALAAFGDTAIEIYSHIKLNQLEKRMEEFDERYSGVRAAAVIMADFEAYRESLRICEQLCMGRVETFSKNTNNTECTCRNPF